jgi:hypothetical protein
MSRVTQAIVVTAAIAAVAACASRPKEVAIVAPPPAPAPVPVYVTPPITPINRGLSPAATVWHMRVALNVAALACRGPQEAVIVQRYNAMLANHKTTLAGAQTALSGQYRAIGGDWQDRYDDSMTRLYNFFSQAQARDAFCTAAAATLAESERLAPGELQAFAAAVLPTLDAPFAEMLAPRPMIAVASPVAAPVAGALPVASAEAAPAPRAVIATRPAAAPVAVGTRAVAAPVRAAPAPIAVAPVAVAASVAAPKPARAGAPAPAVGTRVPAPAVASRAPAPAVATRAPWIEVDAAVLRN